MQNRLKAALKELPIRSLLDRGVDLMRHSHH